MNIPRVILRSTDDGREYEFRNTSTDPYRYDLTVDFPGNDDPAENRHHNFRVISNGRFIERTATVTVLSRQMLEHIVSSLNFIGECLYWETFDGESDFVPLDTDGITLDRILERLTALENACTVGTFDDPVPTVKRNCSYNELMNRIERLYDTVSWISV